MSKERLRIGKKGEDCAYLFLKKNGYKVIERNYRCCLGEIDLVALDGEILTFIEIKTKTSDFFALPQLSVDRRKQLKVAQIASYYLLKKKIKDVSCRFDVVAVTGSIESKTARFELIKDAFQIDE